MIFPDQSHINRVRDALWESPNSNASVMIGSGFSKNAVPAQSRTLRLPDWEEVTTQLYAALYPRTDSFDDPFSPSSGTDGMLRIAQEYLAAFGRTALHDALRRLVPDQEHDPGTIHKRLLGLPWRDIYSTNWDTLLERTISAVPERPYSVIQNMGEIPMASQPRIVKLHGTIGTQYPLIITEEDYRIYPREYAPFVNTVQQAMMETVFLLIGFSGNDPNFLSWSGWVRDNLGESAPKIYLAGFLQLSSHRRRMLEERNVVPIDLAYHPKAHYWPPGLEHTYATEWLLYTLERGRPYDLSNWPSPPYRTVNDIPEPMSDLLLPVQDINAPLPKPESPFGQPSDQAGTSQNPADVVRENVAIWKHNREIYPGWLLAPNSIRRNLPDSTIELERLIVSLAKDLTTLELLDALQELIWRKNILLQPISLSLETIADETLELIDCSARTINGEEIHRGDWFHIRRSWRTTAMELVTAARYRRDSRDFWRRIDSVIQFVGEDQDTEHGVIHEQCLWALNDLDFQELDRLLSSWQTESCDPVWMMRKSALLNEAGHHLEAQALLQTALLVIRATSVNTRSVGMQWREGWALFSSGWEDNSQDTINRLDELALRKCDPRQEVRSIEASLEPAKNEQPPPGFGPGLRRTIRMSGTNYQPEQAAYRAIRMTELAGLPPFIYGSSFPRVGSADILKKVAVEMAEDDPEMAIRLIVRSCRNDNDSTLQKVISRNRISKLTPQQADFFATCCERTIEHSINRISAPYGQQGNTFQTERLRVAMEVLARMAVRLESDRAEAMLDLALRLHASLQLPDRLRLTLPIENLLRSSWESLSKERRARRFFDLLGSPIAGLDGFLPEVAFNYPEPALILTAGEAPPKRTKENEPLLQAAVQLVTRGLNSGRLPRGRASTRAKHLLESNLLNTSETVQIAEALWNPENTPDDDLPRNTDLHDLEFLHLPEPTPGVAQERFRRKWLNSLESQLHPGHLGQTDEEPRVIRVELGRNAAALNRDNTNVNTILWQVGLASLVSSSKGRKLEFSVPEREFLARVIELWTDSLVPNPTGLAITDHERARPLRHALQGLSALIEETSLTADVAERLFRKLKILNSRQIPAYDVAASLLGTIPNHAGDIADDLRVALTSNDVDVVNDAAKALVQWIERSNTSDLSVPQPPEDLVREIGIATASRRFPELVGTLQAAEWVFNKGTAQQQEAISDLVQSGLQFLSGELISEHEHYGEEYIPLLRMLCAKLAAAMAKAGLEERPAVATWLLLAMNDPLPEVREQVWEFLDKEG